MSSTTPRLGLTKPDGGDLFLRQDFINNYNILDQYPGSFICTSTTRPVWTSAQAGQTIIETDTRRILTWDGSLWHDIQSAPAAWIRGWQPTRELEIGSNQWVTLTIGTINVSRAASIAAIYHINAEQNRYGGFGYTFEPLIDNVYAGAYPSVPGILGGEYVQWHTYSKGLMDDYRVFSTVGMANLQPGNHSFGVRIHTGHGTGSIFKMSVLAFMVNSTDV